MGEMAGNFNDMACEEKNFFSGRINRFVMVSAGVPL